MTRLGSDIFSEVTDTDSNITNNTARITTNEANIAALDRLSPDTLAIAIADGSLEDGDSLQVGERTLGNGGGAVWVAVLKSTVTISPQAPVGGGVVECTGNTLLALVLQINSGIYDSVEFGCIYDANLGTGVGTDNTLALQSVIDESTKHATIRFYSNTGNVAFTDKLVFTGDRTYDFGNNRGGGLAMKSGAVGQAVMVADRWQNSNAAEGRPVLFLNPNIHGNKANNVALGAHGILFCNFRPIIVDPYITQTGGDGIHMPFQLRDASPITFKAVGCRIIRPRIFEVDGDAINCNNEAYSDGWLEAPSFGQILGRAVHIVKGSGWFIGQAHSDTVKEELLVVDTASAFDLDGWYLETYNNDANGKAAFSIGGILSDGITLRGIRGNVDAGRTGNFIDLFTANNTSPSIVIDDIQVDFDSSLDGNLKLIGISTGSSSPTKLHVTNVTKAPSEIYDITGTANVDLAETANVWNKHLGTIADYTFIPGAEVKVFNADFSDNIVSWTVNASGNVVTSEYKQQPKTSGTANYDEVFPVVIQAQIAAVFDITVSSHDFFNQTNRGQWVGKFVVSQDTLNETVATVQIELSAATGTLTGAPTITLENVGTVDNTDYQIRVAGSNSTANARTTVIFNG